MKTLQEQLRDKASPMYFTLRSKAADKIDEQEKQIDELRAKLAQAQAQPCATPASDEPVGVVSIADMQNFFNNTFRRSVNETSTGSIQDLPVGTKLYTRPQPAKVTPETAVVPDEVAMIDFLRDQRWELTITYRGQWMCIKENMSDCAEAFDDPREAIKSAMLKGEK